MFCAHINNSHASRKIQAQLMGRKRFHKSGERFISASTFYFKSSLSVCMDKSVVKEDLMQEYKWFFMHRTCHLMIFCGRALSLWE
jgi:hypothetical protein